MSGFGVTPVEKSFPFGRLGHIDVNIHIWRILVEKHYRCGKHYGHLAVKFEDGVDMIEGESVERRIGRNAVDSDIVAIYIDRVRIHLYGKKQSDIEVVGRGRPLVVFFIYGFDDFFGDHSNRRWENRVIDKMIEQILIARGDSTEYVRLPARLLLKHVRVALGFDFPE